MLPTFTFFGKGQGNPFLQDRCTGFPRNDVPSVGVSSPFPFLKAASRPETPPKEPDRS